MQQSREALPERLPRLGGGCHPFRIWPDPLEADAERADTRASAPSHLVRTLRDAELAEASVLALPYETLPQTACSTLNLLMSVKLFGDLRLPPPVSDVGREDLPMKMQEHICFDAEMPVFHAGVSRQPRSGMVGRPVQPIDKFFPNPRRRRLSMSADLAFARRQGADDPATILIVDNDPGILSEIEAYISGHGYRVHTAASAVQMDTVLAAHEIQLLLLDIMMPGEDGLSVCRRLSARGELQIILMSARGEDVDRIVGLELGADHYLPKPFNPRELLAQIRALSRRRTLALKVGERTGERQFRGWRLQPARHRLLSPEEVQVTLTQGEFKMLMAFVDHPEITLGRAFLREAVELDETDRTSRVVDTMVSRLRAKLGQESGQPGFIQTIRNDGYVFTAAVTHH